MELWQLLLIIGILLATLVAFVWAAVRISSATRPAEEHPSHNRAAEAIQQGIDQAFTDEFKAELQQRARVKFDAIMEENAKFLQQDVRVSASRLDEFMKNEILNSLKQELAKHQEEVTKTKHMLNESVTRAQSDIQREMQSEKEAKIQLLNDNITEVVKKYVVSAVGETMDVDKQLALIVDNLNAHKGEIIEDIRNINV